MSNTSETAIDFIYTTGRNKGKVNKSKLGRFLNINANSMKYLADKHPQRFECIYLGAFCKSNNIKKTDLLKLINESKEDEPNN